MTNKEFYKDEIKKHMEDGTLYRWAREDNKFLTGNSQYAPIEFCMWLDEEYVEPKKKDEIELYDVYKDVASGFNFAITAIDKFAFYTLYEDGVTCRYDFKEMTDRIRLGYFTLESKNSSLVNACTELMELRK